MYAPLDFRFVIGPETYDHQFTTKQSGHGSSWIRPHQKTNPCSCVPIRGRGLLTLVAQNGRQNFTSVSSASNLSLNQAPNRIRNRGQEGRLSPRLAVNIHHPCNLAKRGYNIRNPSGIRLLDLGDMAIAEIHKEAMTDTRYKTIAPTQ